MSGASNTLRIRSLALAAALALPIAAGGYALFGDGGETRACGDLVVTDGRWHDAVFVLTGDTATIWCDGRLLARRAGVSRGPNTATGILIGATHEYTYNDRSGYFRGTIDEIRISSVVREPSDDELAVDAHTIALWRFEEPSGETARDASPNRLDGRLVKARRTAAGRRGGAIELSGSGFVIVPDSDLFSTPVISIEVSFKTSFVPAANKDHSPMIVSKYVNRRPEASEFCAFISGMNRRGLALAGTGSNACYCPPMDAR